jgi:hypothetical protein
MLFPHSGRQGFDAIPANPKIPSPSKAMVTVHCMDGSVVFFLKWSNK